MMAMEVLELRDFMQQNIYIYRNIGIYLYYCIC